jgi:hypothetical protein
MTGAAALKYLQRRLAEFGLAVEQERVDELYDLITEGRDEMVSAFALGAPIVVKQTITLTPDVSDRQLYLWPAGTKDPYRVLRVYDAGTGEDLIPSSALNFDNGHYAWDSLTRLRLADFVGLTGALRVEAVLAAAPIDQNTPDDFQAWGIPTTCHRAACKYAAVLALTADEESAATAAMGLFQREVERLEKLYGDYDANGGLALREALLKSIGEHLGDSLY